MAAMRCSVGVPQDVPMPEGHTLFALARDLDAAFAGTSPQVTSPQGKFAAGASLLDGREMVHATSWGKHLFAEFSGDAWLHVHLGLIGTFTIDEHAYAGEVPVIGQVRFVSRRRSTWATCADPTSARSSPRTRSRRSRRARAGPAAPRPGPRGGMAQDLPQRAEHRRAPHGPVGARRRGQRLPQRGALPAAGRPVPPRRRSAAPRGRRSGNDLVELLPLGVATGKIVTVTEQVERVRADLARGEVDRLEERTSYVYRRAGEACRVCGSRVRTRVVAGRNLFWCGRCQRRR